MRVRIIAVVVAAVLAIVGGVVLVDYVKGADARAQRGIELTAVLVVTVPIPAGMPPQVGVNVASRKVIRADVVPGAVMDAAALTGLVATTPLVAGEQLNTARLSTAQAFAQADGSVAVPEGLQEISVSLDPQRVIGGRLAPGDHVGVFVSTGTSSTDGRTRLQLSQVLVTAVDTGIVAAPEAADGATGVSPAATTVTGPVTVGLAVDGAAAATIVYAAEFGHIWLSLQTDSTRSSSAALTERDLSR